MKKLFVGVLLFLSIWFTYGETVILNSDFEDGKAGINF